MIITLKTLPQATAQEVYDQVKNHLLTQGKQSKDANRCRYIRGKLTCAAGCLIGDPKLAKEFDKEESSAWDDLVVQELVPDTHFALILDLQSVHDNYTPSFWKEQLASVAEKHNLAP